MLVYARTCFGLNFKELSLGRKAYVPTCMLEILHMIKFIMLQFLQSVLCLKWSIKLFCC